MAGHPCATRHAGAAVTGATFLRWFRLSFFAAIASTCATSAWACSCASNLEGGIPQGSFIGASIVARATMIGTVYVPAAYCDKHWAADCRPEWAGVFWIQETLKGSPKTLARIRFDTSDCAGPMPRIGETTWVAAVGDAERGYSFRACMWFHPPAEGEGGPLAETIARYQGRLKHLSEAVEQAPSDPTALMALAAFHVETHGRLEAIRTLDRLLAEEPLHREAVLLKADQLAIGPDQSAVLDALAEYLANNPEDKDALRRRVIALVRLDRIDDVPVGWRDFTGLHGAKFDFSNRKLNNASFRDNRMPETSFAGADLEHADFSSAKLWKGSFAGANLTGAAMAKVDLSWADLRNAVLIGADLTNASLGLADFTGAKLERANLSRANLYRANLGGLDLSNTTLTGAHYDDTTVWPAGFDPVAAGAVKQQ